MRKLTRKQALYVNDVSGHLSTMSRDITRRPRQDSNLRSKEVAAIKRQPKAAVLVQKSRSEVSARALTAIARCQQVGTPGGGDAINIFRCIRRSRCVVSDAFAH